MKYISMFIKFYDVEHGSCTHIITPNNKHFLIDIGSKASISMAEYLKSKYFCYSGNTIDSLMITHPHEDHIYDLPKLYDLSITPKVLYRPRGAFDVEPTLDTELHKRIANTANFMNDNYNGQINEAENPTNPNFNGGINIDLIYPKNEWTTKDDINTFSNIIVINYCGYKFVLTGDNPRSVLQNMMDSNYDNIRNKITDATALLAPHHGRTGEFCQDFFDCVNPYITIVSDKSIIHDTQTDTSKLYKGRGIPWDNETRYVLTTRNDGTITAEINSEKCWFTCNKEEY